jgi:hypothetical protein
MGVCVQQIGFGNLGQLATGSIDMTIRQDIADSVYTSVEITTLFTDEAILNAIGNIRLDGIDSFRNAVPFIATQMNSLGQQLTVQFLRDQRRLEMVQQIAEPNNAGVNPVIIPPAANLATTIVASRQGDPMGQNGAWGQNNNPVMRNSAWGVVPQETVGVIPPAPLFPEPSGTIPAGIEHLIVQVLLGQNQIPATPQSLNTDS